MKRLLFIIMVFLISIGSTEIEGQTLKKNTTSKYGKYTWYQYPGDTVSAEIVHIINAALPPLAAVDAARLDSMISDLASSLIKLINISSNTDSSLVLETARNLVMIAVRDTLIAQHADIVGIRNFLANDSLTVVDMVNLKNLLTQINAKDFSTSALQDTMIARWNTWLASDWATKTLQENIRDTLKVKFDLLIAKDFATAAKQDTMITRWNTWLASDWATATLQGAIRDSIVAKFNSLLAKDFATENTLSAFADTNKVKLDAILGNQTDGDQTTQLTGSSNNYSTTFTTTGTTIDSVAFGFTTREYTFVNDGVVTDTLYISSASDFPATNTSKLVGLEWQTKRRAVTKLYFKVGATPLASKKIRIEAN